MEYLPYVWIAIMVIMAILEGLTTQLVSIWFVFGALAAAIVSFFVPSFTVQFGVFVGISFLLLLLTRPLVRKTKETKAVPTNADMNIGKTAVVIEEISNLEGKGRVKLGGNTWAARSQNNRIVPEGATVTVREIQGVKLIVTND